MNSAEKPPLFFNSKLQNVTPKHAKEDDESPPNLRLISEKKNSEIKYEMIQRLVNAIDVKDNSPATKQHKAAYRTLYDASSSIGLHRENAPSMNAAAANALTTFNGTPTQTAANGFLQPSRAHSTKKLIHPGGKAKVKRNVN